MASNRSKTPGTTAAGRIDALLKQVAVEYHSLPRYENLAKAFREAVTHAGLPGGYKRRDGEARPLVETLGGGE